MADFTRAEILNEVSRIFNAVIDPGREGGTLNTAAEYQSLLEISSLTLILHNDGIFYLSRLAANKLAALVDREIAFIEDMLVAVDDLGQIGEPVSDTTTINNAVSALLELDAASSVQDRAETARFTQLMDQFAENFRRNVVSRSRSSLVRPREDARNVISADFAQLQVLHSRLITQTTALRDLLDNFIDLDVPSKAAAAAFTRIRRNLQDINDFLETASDAENIAASRRNLLRSLASKAGVEVISTFSDPRGLKYRSPTNPIPSGLTHTGRVTGTGTPASLITGSGPWLLPMSDDLVLEVDEGASQTVVLTDIIGAALNGLASESFEVTSENQNLHVIVNPAVNVVPLTSHDNTTLLSPEYIKLGFRDLGAYVAFREFNVDTPAVPDSHYNLRAILELRGLKSYTSLAWNASLNRVTLAGLANLDEPSALNDDHVGAYILDGAGQRFEILEVVSGTELEIDPRGLTPNLGAGTVRGSVSGGTDTELTFDPPLSITGPNYSAQSVSIGPSVKTAQLTTGTRTAAQVVTDLNSGAGAFDAGHLAALSDHVLALPVAGDSTRVALVNRSRFEPYLQITSRFVRPRFPTAPADVVGSSANALLGFAEGIVDTTNLLSPSELANAVNAAVTGATAEVVETAVLEASTLQTAEGSTVVTDTSQNFLSLGVQEGDQVILEEGNATGISQVVAVTATTLDLDRAPFVANEAVDYSILRQQVQISSNTVSRGSTIEATTAPSELLLPSGLQEGSIPQFEAVTRSGALLEFSGVVAGDRLRLVGERTTTNITAVDGTTLTLEQGLSSTTEGAGFEIQSAAAQSYTTMASRLTTYVGSPNLLAKNGFDEDLTEIDNALVTALLPGQRFVAARNRVRQLLAELLSVLTNQPRRSGEYTATIPTAPSNLESILSSFTASPVPPIDRLIDAFLERKYDRAADLLQTGRLGDFFNTNDETGSFGGTVLASSRVVAGDLPNPPIDSEAVDDEINVARHRRDNLPDPEFNFDDFEINEENEVSE